MPSSNPPCPAGSYIRIMISETRVDPFRRQKGTRLSVAAAGLFFCLSGNGSFSVKMSGVRDPDQLDGEIQFLARHLVIGVKDDLFFCFVFYRHGEGLPALIL